MSSDLQKTYGCDALQFVRDVIGKQYHIDAHIGSGSYGDVYSLTCSKVKKCNRVVKLLYDNYAKIQAEINSQRYFASYGLAPRIFRSEALRKSDNDKALVVIMMEKIDGVLTDLLSHPLSNSSLQQICEVIYDIIVTMCQIMALHGDLHWNNIGYKRTSKGGIRLILIDFGFSLTDAQCRPDLEIAQLLRSLHLLSRKIDHGNVEYLSRYFTTLYEKSYGQIQSGYNTLWRGLVGQHVLVHEDAVRHGNQPPITPSTELTLERLSPETITELLKQSLTSRDYYTVNRILESQYGKLVGGISLPDEYFQFISIGALFRVMTNMPRREARRVEQFIRTDRPEMVRVLDKIKRRTQLKR